MGVPSLAILKILVDKFDIRVYHTQHNNTGYEISIQNEDCFTWAEITEQEYKILSKKFSK